MTIRIGFLVFPDIQLLDLAGPHDVFALLPDVSLHLVWKNRQPLKATSGMLLTPDTTFDDCPPLDILCVPGGRGGDALLQDAATLSFLRKQAQQARYITAICTGSLILGAAGLLEGRRATCHWACHDLLAQLGAIPVHARVVQDGNLLTGGGVTAGIDFALTLAAELFDSATAQELELMLEYAPQPPGQCGTPALASPETLASAQEKLATLTERRRTLIASL